MEKGFTYRGDSLIISPKGKKIADAGKREEVTRTVTLSMDEVTELRTNSPHGKTQDTFTILPED